ncbi:MAG: Vitamin B12 dependent methionine synthase activation subunit [Clostridia bacterium]|nr:Vitamin B12 dependent methionine synthase activation subunit [Clostridia bacterium]
MIRFLSGKITKIDKKQTMIFLGYAGVKDLDGAEKIYAECEQMILPVVAPKACYELFDIGFNGGEIDLGFAKTTSHSLGLNLKGCDRIALFAATAGAGIDRLIVKYNKISPSRAVILQAMGAAAVEEWCDDVNGQITREYGETKPRFSCGYGDLPLTMQRDIFRALNVTKNLGVTLTDGDLMIPSKSVTAIVGIKAKG